MKIRLNLRIQWMIYITAVIILSTGITGFIYMRYEIHHTKAWLKNRGIILAQNLSFNSEFAVLTENVDILSNFLKGVMKTEDVVYAAIFDSAGNVLSQKGRIIQKDTLMPNEILVKEYTVDSEDFYLITVPIVTEELKRIKDESSLFATDKELTGTPESKKKTTVQEQEMTLFENHSEEQKKIIGKSVIGMSEKNTILAIKKMINTSILTAVIITIFCIGMLIIIVNKMVAPIYVLAGATQKVAKGDFKTKVNIQRSDELGTLADSFNAMIKDLENTTVSRNALVQEVAERRKAEEKLINYSRQLERSNKELDNFTYTISHDLKEPLRSINAFSKFIEQDYKDKLGEKGKDYLDRITANAGRMHKLIEELLEISGIERKQNPFTDVDVNEVINEATLRLEYAINQKNNEIIIRTPLPIVSCDRVRLKEVFVNLISNAVKFNDKEKIIIEIGCEQSGDYYLFYVKDNGPGIEEKYYGKIFEIFQRLGKREDTEGTGAGLTIVKRIVELYMGKIWVESRVGENATFYFTIPKDRDAITGKMKIGEVLVSKKLINTQDLNDALEEQAKTGYE